MEATEPQTRRWTVEEYDRMADAGMFRDQRVELIDGEIVRKGRQKPPHAAGISLTADALAAVFGPGYCIRQQMPLHFGEASEPEPDIAVVRGGPRDYIGTGHPASALLIVEVADGTLRYDRSLYASRSIADYWIADLQNRRLEVYRDPAPDDTTERFGARYQNVTTLDPSQSITPLAARTPAALADLLP